MDAVGDTSSLIHPAKVPAMWKLMIDTFDRALIPSVVQNEILKGREFGSSDMPIIEKSYQRWMDEGQKDQIENKPSGKGSDSADA